MTRGGEAREKGDGSDERWGGGLTHALSSAWLQPFARDGLKWDNNYTKRRNPLADNHPAGCSPRGDRATKNNRL